MSVDVAVILVSFESRDHIAACLTSLREEQSTVRTIVVDNASRDGTPDLIRQLFPEVTLTCLSRNVGFAAGVNRGIRECTDASLFFLLNPDSVVMPKAIARLVAFMKGQPKVGIVGPLVFDDLTHRSVQPSCRRFPTLLTGALNRYSLLSRLFKGNAAVGRYLYRDEDLAGPRVVDWVSGCAMLVRREVFDTVSLFDEGFFFFCEDIDFCWRARKAGWEVMYYPEASVVHFAGKSAEQVPYRTLVAKHRSMVRLYKKHIRKTILTDPIIYGVGWARLAFLLARESLRQRNTP